MKTINLAKKIYDFPFDKIKDTVQKSLMKLGNKGSVSDVITHTTLPRHQVEAVLPALVQECRGQMKVGERGDILYYFPKGMANTQKGFMAQLKSLGQSILKGAAWVFTVLFKVWITVMVIGYFLLYVTLLVLALLAATAVSTANKNSSRRSDVGIFHLAGKILSWTIRLWVYSGMISPKAKKRKWLHESFYEFVFGVDRKDQQWAITEKQAIMAHIQKNKGVVTLEEVMALSGRNRERSNAFISTLLLEMDGEPMVSDQGALYYFFPGLLKSTVSTGTDPRALHSREELPFSRNPKSTNGWIVFFNSFNLLLGIYFTFFSLFPSPEADLAWFSYFVNEISFMVFGGADGVSWALGYIPLIYSILFFTIPVFRRMGEKAFNLKLKEQKSFMDLVDSTLSKPKGGIPTQINGKDTKRLVLEIAGDRTVDVELVENQEFYIIQNWSQEIKDLQKVREQVDPSQYSMGKTVFDSGE